MPQRNAVVACSVSGRVQHQQRKIQETREDDPKDIRYEKESRNPINPPEQQTVDKDHGQQNDDLDQRQIDSAHAKEQIRPKEIQPKLQEKHRKND